MATTPPNKTFFLQSPSDYLKKLEWDKAQLHTAYRSDPGFIYQFMNCAQTAWHMVDWIAAEFAAPNPPSSAQINSLKNEVRADCVALLICRELADSAKHRFLTSRPNADIASIQIGADVKVEGFQFWCIDSYSSNDARLTGESLGVRDPTEVIGEAIAYWTEYIRLGRVPEFVSLGIV